MLNFQQHHEASMLNCQDPLLLSLLITEDVSVNNGLCEDVKGIRQSGGIYYKKVGLYYVYIEKNSARLSSKQLTQEELSDIEKLCEDATTRLKSINCNSHFIVLFSKSELWVHEHGMSFDDLHFIWVDTVYSYMNKLHTLIHESAHQIYRQLPKQDKMKIIDYYNINVFKPSLGKEVSREFIEKKLSNILTSDYAKVFISKDGTINQNHPGFIRWVQEAIHEAVKGLSMKVNLTYRDNRIIALTNSIRTTSDFIPNITSWIIKNLLGELIFRPELNFNTSPLKDTTPTPYAATNPNELFAELITQFLLEPEKIKRQSKMDNLLRYIINFIR
jgi:hypothetical protein